ncbi:MAG: hypothetical protein J6X66_07335 [Lachnospiraceae bacterium]|nr:hypothetical protein [Lachnospiraceae bacterium]
MQIKRGKIKKLNDSGTTLIETLAAFTVLAAILAILFHIVDFSSRLRTQAVDTAHLDQMFWRELYKNDENIDSSFIEVNEFVRDENGKIGVFWLALDVDNTDPANIEMAYKNGNVFDVDYLRENPPVFYLDNIGASSYSCIDTLIDEEQLPRPVAMSFHYYAPEAETSEP